MLMCAIKCESNCLDIASFILFADDTNIFVNGKDTLKAVNKINIILSKLKLYLEANFLHINIKKSATTLASSSLLALYNINQTILIVDIMDFKRRCATL